MKHIDWMKYIIILFSLVIFGGIFLAGIKRVDRYLNILAIHDCATDYRKTYTSERTGITVYRPLEQQVRECVWNKGVRDWTGVWSGFEQIPDNK